jgi:hypothetical protein
MNDIVFTDRYGGRSPSVLTSCHECEAMGCYPSNDPTEWPADAEVDDLGYVFVVCPECDGTARVTWLKAIARIPGWLWSGIKFIWSTRDFAGPGESLLKRLFISFKCAYLADLGLWSPRSGWCNPFSRRRVGV